MLNLPKESISSFTENGFVIVQGIIPLNDLRRILSEISSVTRTAVLHHNAGVPALGDTVENIHYNLSLLHSHNQDLLVAVYRTFSRLKSLYEVFLSEPVFAVAKRLGIRLGFLHTHPLFHVLSYRLRIDNGYHGFNAHQDWSGLQSSLNTVVMWTPLHDIDSNQFPIEVARGSHLHGVAPAQFKDNSYTLDQIFLDGLSFSEIIIEAGDMIFFSPFLVHRTGIRDYSGLRLAASWRIEDAIEPTYVKRGFPMAQSRIVNHAPLIDGFPTASDFSI